MPRKQQPGQALTKQHFSASIEEIKSNAGAFIDRLLGEAETQVQRAETFREIPSRAHEIGHAAAALLSAYNDKMNEEQPWETLGISIAEYKKQTCHDDVVIPGVEAFSRAEARRNNFTKEIKENWGVEWRSHIKNMLPPQDSEHALATMRRISIKMPIHTFQENLAAAIKERLDNWRSGRRTTNLATVTDLHTVEKMVTRMITSTTVATTAEITAAEITAEIATSGAIENPLKR
jgi:hypothetical protein